MKTLSFCQTGTSGYYQIYLIPQCGHDTGKHIGDVCVESGTFYARHYFNLKREKYCELCDSLTVDELTEIIDFVKSERELLKQEAGIQQ